MRHLIIPALIVAIFYIIAMKRRRIPPLELQTGRTESFSCAVSVHETIKTIIRFAQQSGYRIAALDEAAGQVVLEESMTLFSWGFLLPVSISEEPDGSTLVEVGIQSKAVQVGPVVTRSLDRCVSGIKAALLAEEE